MYEFLFTPNDALDEYYACRQRGMSEVDSYVRVVEKIELCVRMAEADKMYSYYATDVDKLHKFWKAWGESHIHNNNP